MVGDAQATKARILDAAVTEFAAHGLAGGRVDRVATAAPANKRLIYVHFGSKEQLFDAALHHVIEAVAEAVPLTEDDLPGYAGRLFDHSLERPEAWRMNMWRQLERPHLGPEETEVFAAKLASINQPTFPPTGLPPADLLILVLALPGGWLTSSTALRSLRAADSDGAGWQVSHRASIVEAVRRLCTRPSGSGPTTPVEASS